MQSTSRLCYTRLGCNYGKTRLLHRAWEMLLMANSREFCESPAQRDNGSLP
jgi:hypothetical protein